MTPDQPANPINPPPAKGVRLDWAALPIGLRDTIEKGLGSAVIGWASQPTGFSPGVAARLRLADGRRVFLKAVSSAQNPHSPAMHRREGQVVAALPPGVPVPRLLWSYDEGEPGWVVLVFEEIDGTTPAVPWQADEFERVLAAFTDLSAALTPSPLPLVITGSASDDFAANINGWQRLRDGPADQRARLDDWCLRHLDQLAELEAAAPQAVAGDTLLHSDLRADNILLTPERVWFIDWPHACPGAAWVDLVGFLPAAAMQGGPHPEEVIARHPTSRSANPADITAAVASLAGYFIHRSLQPPPPGLPTVRAFQAAQGVVAVEWLSRRIG
jgi:hypothetical protein